MSEHRSEAEERSSGERRGGDAPVARRVVVAGVVQGVFFRDECRRRAADAGVAGWVHNRPDGQVEAWFEGHPGRVDELVRWCREGPAHAEVTDVEISEEAPTGEAGFRVR